MITLFVLNAFKGSKIEWLKATALCLAIDTILFAIA
jgi:hypothetical protein